MCVDKTLSEAHKYYQPVRWPEPGHLIIAFKSMPVVGEEVRPLIRTVTSKIMGESMIVQNHRRKLFWTLGLVFFLLVGCNEASSKHDLQVMFDGRPNITQPDVYFANKVVGKITDRQMGKGSVEMIAISLLPEFKKQIGRHWVFFVDNGRIQAARIGSADTPISDDDRLCGFRSKSAFNWFRFKTLLSDRVYKASLRAEMLHRRFAL